MWVFFLSRGSMGERVVKVLFERGAKVDSREQLEKTALHCEAISENQDTIRVLVASSVDGCLLND